jgi:tRNA dimethylallyltransferase
MAGIKVPVILGPTGVGKSRAAFELAQALGGEILVCDSRQVYDRLDIATNKPSPEEMREVRYHLVGIADPARLFTVFDFVQAAGAALAEITARGRIAIVEGGSMLWADALMDGFSLAGVPPRPERRMSATVPGWFEPSRCWRWRARRWSACAGAPRRPGHRSGSG